MEKLVLIKDKKSLDDFMQDYLHKHKLYAVDTEATGLTEADEIIGNTGSNIHRLKAHQFR